MNMKPIIIIIGSMFGFDTSAVVLVPGKKGNTQQKDKEKDSVLLTIDLAVAHVPNQSCSTLTCLIDAH